jgi:hypothetical protein
MPGGRRREPPDDQGPGGSLPQPIADPALLETDAHVDERAHERV